MIVCHLPADHPILCGMRLCVPAGNLHQTSGQPHPAVVLLRRAGAAVPARVIAAAAVRIQVLRHSVVDLALSLRWSSLVVVGTVYAPQNA